MAPSPIIKNISTPVSLAGFLTSPLFLGATSRSQRLLTADNLFCRRELRFPLAMFLTLPLGGNRFLIADNLSCRRELRFPTLTNPSPLAMFLTLPLEGNRFLTAQDYLVFGSDLGFRSQMLRFSRNIASTARSYSGKMFTHIK